MKRQIFIAASISLFTTATPVLAEDGDSILNSKCSGCHALTKPDDLSLDRLWERKGPDLFYAGDKFNKPWLVQWLQAPVPIRPAGEFYRKYVKPGEKSDIIDSSKLKPHPKLSQSEAEVVADTLMTLTDSSNLIEKGKFKGEKVSASMGRMFFTKLRGCAACHSDSPGKGGLSAPELYTAGSRLQPDYIYSYTKHPQKIDPAVWMPRLELSEQDLQRLTGYIVQLDAGRD
ncbi:c-type cytochrome [Nitrosomonas halophila]|uniref:Cytochrome c n=1 Tax=Nitrosomonas halophila TaxID=44576 RepID=A0A1H3NS15_9PROT|nr:cytochrome c [Nitrosomonas halophila]SDY90969.1 Cytochrome c [Nitrosomonas halophila]